MWKPKYTLTDSITDAILEIGRAQGSVESHSWSPLIEERIRFKARVRSTHYSTAIEGNRLTLAEAEEVVRSRGVTFAGRKRDVVEVERYWKALTLVQEWAEEHTPVSEESIRKLHAVVHEGVRAKPTPYREAQNFVLDSASGGIVYAPPTPGDVPAYSGQIGHRFRSNPAGWSGVSRPRIPEHSGHPPSERSDAGGFRLRSGCALSGCGRGAWRLLSG